MRLATLLLMLALGSAGARGALAATFAGETSEPVGGPARAPDLGAVLPGFVDANRYHVGPGDGLTLLLWGAISRTQPLFVGPEGNVVIPDVGSVNVAGATLAEARELIRERVRKQLRNLEIEVQLTHLRTFRVYVTGAVRTPGPVPANGVMSVGDLLADSLLLGDASRRRVELRRDSGATTIVDLQTLRLAGQAGRQEWLREGDVVYVPRATEWTGAWGAVGHPGAVELADSDSVSTLVRLAGGLLPRVLGDQAMLVRWRDTASRETLMVRFADGRIVEGDVPLRDGDQLFVLSHPGWHEPMVAWVVGRVQREGAFPITAGKTRLTDVIASAGGLLEDADRSAIRLVRNPPGIQSDPEFDRLLRLSREEMTNSEYEAFRARLAAHSADVRVDWTLLESGRTDLDLLMQDGDVLRVDRVTNAVRVDGQVKRPGLVPFVAGKPTSYYIEQAGGFTVRAARGQVRLTRAANNQGMLARDVQDVSPGDQLWVPETPDVKTWEIVKDLLIVCAQIATIYLVFR